MDIWKDKASGPLHLIHLGYGAGSFIVLQLVAPFISENLPTTEETSDNSVCATVTALATKSSNSANITTLAPIPSDNLGVGFWMVSAVFLPFLYFGSAIFSLINGKPKMVPVLRQKI